MRGVRCLQGPKSRGGAATGVPGSAAGSGRGALRMMTRGHQIIRRSILLVPVTDRTAVSNSWRHDADAIALDLGDTVPDGLKAAARGLVKDSIAAARRG